MRLTTYLDAKHSFDTLKKLVDRKDFPRNEIMTEVKRFREKLEESALYAGEATRGLTRKKLKRYRFDKKNGILEEELVLRSFLEEILSALGYLQKHMETDMGLRGYKERIQRLRNLKKPGESSLSKILDGLDSVSRSSKQEIRSMVDMIGERYIIGNNLLAVIRARLGE